jgi:hypothetical protein
MGRSRKSTREKPFAIVRSEKQTSNSFGPKSLVQITLRVLTNEILTGLNLPEHLKVLEHSVKIKTLPTMLLDMLEKQVNREAELYFSLTKWNEAMFKIWKIFFNAENPSESLRNLNLQQSECSMLVLERLSVSETPLKIVDLTLNSTLLNSTFGYFHYFGIDEDEFKERLELILKKSLELESVHLIGRFFDDDCLHSIAKFGAKKLKTLRLSNSGSSFNDTGRVTDEGIVDFVDQLLSNSDKCQLKVFDVGQWHTSNAGLITSKGIVYLNKLDSLTEIHFRLSHLNYCDFVLDKYRDLIEIGNRITSVYLYSELKVFEEEFCKDTKDILSKVHLYLERFFPQLVSLHLKSFCSSSAKDCPLLFLKFGGKIKSCDLTLAKDLDFWLSSFPDLQSLTISDPKLGLKWDHVSHDSLRIFHFDDAAFFINFDFIAQVGREKKSQFMRSG